MAASINPIATIQMKNGSKIVVELRPDLAPNTVNSFIYLARKGIYDGYKIARVEPGYVVDVTTNACNKEVARYLIANEAEYVKESLRLRPDLGIIAMGGYGGNIAGGEFYFPLAFNQKLCNYPRFGQVLEGSEEIVRIGQGPVEAFAFQLSPNFSPHKPVHPEIIECVTVETFGVEYPEPVRLEGVACPAHWSMEEYDSLI